jgi:hypothetical protein
MNGTKDRKVKPDFAQYGFAHQENLIMACIGGSQAHGAKLGTTDDTDWYGLYIPPATKLLGLEREDHFVFTTGGKVGGNGPQDVDVCLYTLMKWAGLAAIGNPSALHFLFAPVEFTTATWDHFSARPEIFLAKGHVKPFLKKFSGICNRPCSETQFDTGRACCTNLGMRRDASAANTYAPNNTPKPFQMCTHSTWPVASMAS